MSDATGAKTGAQGRGPNDRPMSPHLQVWRWHVTMATSILHRGSGMALYVGVLVLAGWVASLAGGAETYGGYMTLLGSPLGLLVLFGLTVAFLYHLANGIRHLFWDSGKGFEPKTADMTGWAAIAFGIVAAVLIWIIAFLHMGAPQ
jgi:succinate dehydrogenase / fumarate reductase cytochrome b subunit